MRIKEKNSAIVLRKEGHSYATIQHKLDVSKSTLSGWLRDIPYAPNSETKKKMQEGQLRSALAKNRQKLESLRIAEIEAEREIGKLSEQDLFLIGVGLYIGEGSKTASITRIVNSDPRIIKLGVVWFTKACGLSLNNLVVRIHGYPDTDIEEASRFWHQITKIPLKNFQLPSIDRRQDKKRNKQGQLPYGTAHISVRANGNPRFGVFLARKIEKWSNCIFKQSAGLV